MKYYNIYTAEIIGSSCRTCGGSGTVNHHHAGDECFMCNGTGKVNYPTKWCDKKHAWIKNPGAVKKLKEKG